MRETRLSSNDDILSTQDDQFITFYVDSGNSKNKCFNFTVLTSDKKDGEWYVHYSRMVNNFLVPNEVKLDTNQMGKFYKCQCENASVTVYSW